MIPGLEPGMLFGGRYEIIRCIGTGGMGAVYLACDPDYRDFLVALKILYPGIVQSKEARERFRNEIVASYRVNHKNVVRAFEYFDSDEAQAYAMEHIDGGDLGDLMEKHSPAEPMPIRQVISILSQIAAGLEAIHEEGIVHRDLKPENVLLTKDKVAKISDFGVARLRGSITLTAAGSMVGTPKYVSPEYVELGECDQRSDIYAAGIIGYELIAGESPFKSDSRLSIMMERFNFRPQDLRKRAARCPPELVRIIAKAMSVKVDDRYHSAGQMHHDLECVLRGEQPLYAKDIIEQPSDTRDTSRVPGLDDVALLSGIVNQKEILAKYYNKSHESKRNLFLVVLCIVGVVAGLFFAKTGFIKSDSGFAELPNGLYAGTAKGLFSSSSNTPLSIWKTGKGVFLLLGKSHCSVTKISSEGEFSCGDLRFIISVNNVSASDVSGNILEKGWSNNAVWSLKQNES